MKFFLHVLYLVVLLYLKNYKDISIIEKVILDSSTPYPFVRATMKLRQTESLKDYGYSWKYDHNMNLH